MDIKAQFCTFIGANFEQIFRCYLAKIESFDNITGEGILTNGYYIYEYFTITDNEETFRFCVKGYNYYNTYRIWINVAGPSSSGGSGLSSDYMLTTNAGISLHYYIDSSTGTYYDNCWVFSSGNNFVGITIPFAETNAPQGWFLFLKNQDNEFRLIPTNATSSYQLSVYDSEYSDQSRYLTQLNYDISDNTARKQDLPDYVYIETATYSSSQTYIFGILPDLYYLMNFMIYDYGAGNYQKSFQLVGTEDGNYMHLNQVNFIKIAEVLEKSVVKYEAS